MRLWRGLWSESMQNNEIRIRLARIKMLRRALSKGPFSHLDSNEARSELELDEVLLNMRK